MSSWRKAVVWGYLCLFAMSAAQTGKKQQDNRRAEKAFEDGRRAETAGDYAKAIEDYGVAIQMAPEFAAAWAMCR